MTNAEFFASGHAILRRLIAWGPIAFGVRLGLAGALLLLLGARIAGVHSFPVGDDDRGFWFETNWSLMYPLVWPAVFGGLVYMINLMRDAIARLTSEPLGVIRRKGDAPDFGDYIASEMSRNVAGFTTVCITLAVVLQGIHAATLVQFLIRRRGAPPMLDWTTMFVSGRPSFTANVVFDAVAYVFEAFIIFLGFFFVLKFWMFLQVFSRALRDDAAPYEFHPLVHDPDQRLGLRPLGRFMNVYLVLVIVFEVYVLGRRLQLIGKSGVFSLSEYLTAMVDVVSNYKIALDPRMYQWSTIDGGLWGLLIFLTLPLIVGAYLPLWTLRRYVAKRRDDEWAASARAHEEAKERGDDAAAESLARKMQFLQKTQLWPNGDAIGWRLLVTSVAIALAAWAPPLFVAIAGVAVTLQVGKWLIGIRPRLSGSG
jgi:hypothetical protein